MLTILITIKHIRERCQTLTQIIFLKFLVYVLSINTEPRNIALAYVTSKMYVNKLYDWKYYSIRGKH